MLLVLRKLLHFILCLVPSKIRKGGILSQTNIFKFKREGIPPFSCFYSLSNSSIVFHLIPRISLHRLDSSIRILLIMPVLKELTIILAPAPPLLRKAFIFSLGLKSVYASSPFLMILELTPFNA